MILSHKHKFIFLRTCKTASSAIEFALSRHCGPDDIITPDRREDEEIRASIGGVAPQNYDGQIPITNRRFWRKIIMDDPSPKFHDHIQGRDVRDYIDRSIWERYYKFCFERNPWDKAVSLYFWRYKKEPRPSFSEYVHSGKLTKTVLRQGRDLYRINGHITVDKVYLYEELDTAWKDICEKIEIPHEELPLAKNTERKAKTPYTEFMSQQDAQKIAEIFKKEIDEFGYQYGA